ncbi:lysophospholipid acyltransferase family protein [Parasphingorhabdus pacifica]
MVEEHNLRRKRRKTKEKARGLGKFWLGLAAFVFYPVSGLLARTRSIGLRNVPAEGPVLLVFNHVSHLDPIYDAVAVHRTGRIPRFLAKSTLWNVPVLKSVLSGVQQIPVFRGTADAQKSLLEAHNALEEDRVVLIYPDGTITKDPDGWPMNPRVGVARLALEHDVPVVPAARWGTRSIYDHYEKKFRPLPRKQVTYNFGEPVDLSAYRDKEVNNQLLREVTDLTMSRVRELLADIREEQAPTEFYSPVRRMRDRGEGDDA